MDHVIDVRVEFRIAARGGTGFVEIFSSSRADVRGRSTAV